MSESAGNPPKKPEIPEEIKAGWQRIVDLMARTAGVPAGLPGLHDLRLPAWGTITKGSEA